MARNGYTGADPTVDSTAVAGESIEFATSLADLLAQRRNTLATRAAVVCRFGRSDSGYTVAFLEPRATTGERGRAVSNDTEV